MAFLGIGYNGDGLKLVAPLLIKDKKMMLTDKPSEQIF